MPSIRIICPNGHLGFAPLKTESFRLAVETRPDFIAADSGSDDIGPVPLGNDSCASPRAWQEHDLEEMLLASRRLGVPMLIGSAGDTGIGEHDVELAELPGSLRDRGLGRRCVGGIGDDRKCVRS